MEDFFKLAFKAYKTHLSGLPSFVRLTMYELFSYCDYSSGTISIGTLDTLVRTDFYVESSPGRKREDINSDTLRNAFRTLKKAKPAHFKFITKNQRIIIEMPFLMSLYSEYSNKSLKDAEGFAVENVTSFSVNLIENKDKTTDSAMNLFTHSSPEDAAASSGEECYINKLKKQTTTKQQPQETQLKKLPISDNFTPSAQTIQTAHSRGYFDPENPTEIQRFIDHNKARGSVWADYNPVYLLWLSKISERKQTMTTPFNVRSRAYATEYTARKETAVERVRRNYQELHFDEKTGFFKHNLPSKDRCQFNRNPLDAIDTNIWDTIC